MNLFNEVRVDYAQVQNSKKWFDDQVKTIARQKITPGKLVASDLKHTLKIAPGNLYFFMYDPKLKEQLPYHDQFPLVFPYKSVPGGFLGLNMHYLDYKARFALFRKLIGINKTKLDTQSRLRFTWASIGQFAALDLAGPCVKHYLMDHVKSPFCKVPTTDWTTAMLMPVERFVGASKQRVWMDSNRK